MLTALARSMMTNALGTRGLVNPVQAPAKLEAAESSQGHFQYSCTTPGQSACPGHRVTLGDVSQALLGLRKRKREARV